MRTNPYDVSDFIMLPVPTSMYAAVCALLGGVSTTALTSTGDAGKPAVTSKPDAAPAAEPIADGGEPANDTAIDAAGWPWDEKLHASTRGTTKDGLWRMKVGVSRPDPKPGFPKADGATSTGNDGAASDAPVSATTADAGQDDEDEFAAFRAAADKANATDATAAAGVSARKWTDADLGKLCNQAAVKLGDPTPVKALIEQFTPAGQVPHSRNIPDDQREPFAQAVEAKAEITFAG